MKESCKKTLPFNTSSEVFDLTITKMRAEGWHVASFCQTITITFEREIPDPTADPLPTSADIDEEGIPRRHHGQLPEQAKDFFENEVLARVNQNNGNPQP